MCFSARSTPSTRSPAGSSPQTTNPEFLVERGRGHRAVGHREMQLPNTILRARNRIASSTSRLPKPARRCSLPDIHPPQFGFVAELGPVKPANADGANQFGRERADDACSGSTSICSNELDRLKTIIAGELPNAYGSRSSASRRSARYSGRIAHVVF